MRGSVEGQLTNKCPNIYGSSISNLFAIKNAYKQNNVEQQ
jgi:hypothetical protein